MTQPFKDYIASLANYFQHKFNLTEYRLKIKYYNEDAADGSEVLAQVGINLQYLYLSIAVYPSLYEAYKDGDYEEIVSAMMHEFCHHFTEPLSQRLQRYTSPDNEQDLTELVELCTQRINHAIIPTLPDELFRPPAPKRVKRKRPAKGR